MTFQCCAMPAWRTVSWYVIQDILRRAFCQEAHSSPELYVHSELRMSTFVLGPAVILGSRPGSTDALQGPMTICSSAEDGATRGVGLMPGADQRYSRTERPEFGRGWDGWRAWKRFITIQLKWNCGKTHWTVFNETDSEWVASRWEQTVCQ